MPKYILIEMTLKVFMFKAYPIIQTLICKSYKKTYMAGQKYQHGFEA